MQKRQRSGFTLIEMMFVSVLAAIIMAAAVGVFTAMLEQRRRVEQTVEAYNALSMAQGLLNFDIANAGWRFPASAFSVRVTNNVTGTTSLSLDGMGTGAVTSAANCGQIGWGLKLGTDVIEVAQGWAGEASGTVQSVTGQTSFVLTASTNPLTAAGSGSAIVMFTDGVGNACMAQVTSGVPAVGGTIAITMLGPDYAVEPTPLVRYPACPAAAMHVYRLGQRSRYMVCNVPSTPGVLFRQVSNDNGIFGVAERVQDSVADLQFGVRLHDGATGVTGSGCVGAAGGTQFCYCNVVGACGGVDQNTQAIDFSPTITNARSHQQWIRQVVIGLTGTTPRTVVTGGAVTTPAYRRPAMLDNAAAATGDGRLYFPNQSSVTLSNLAMVTP